MKLNSNFSAPSVPKEFVPYINSPWFDKADAIAIDYWYGDGSALYLLHCRHPDLWSVSDIDKMIAEFKALVQLDNAPSLRDLHSVIQGLKSLKEFIGGGRR